MKAKILKTEEDYQAALEYVSSLMDAAPDSPEEEELNLFAMLVEMYEKEHYPIPLPDPVEAILFRMDQAGLSRKDLIPYIGSQSKVSEVLNHKRPLSLSMIRALNAGLGIPAEVLLQEPGGSLKSPHFNLKDFPFTEMVKRNYFPAFHGSLPEAKEQAEELLESLMAILEKRQTELSFCRRSDQNIDSNALRAWQARVLHIAAQKRLPLYDPARFSPDLMREVIRLSYYSQGPLMAIEQLERNGVSVVILPHLPHTYLDGACFHDAVGRPVIGLTLRHDRLDNFWFTLTHELAHIHLHLNRDAIDFFDDIENGSERICNSQENEADSLAREMLIPAKEWESEKKTVSDSLQEADLNQLADRLHISPSIVAGRLRWEQNNYSIFSNLLGNKCVRKLFSSQTHESFPAES